MLGFPCNQFLGQEPGTDDEIQACTRQMHNVRFPILAKTNVNGSAVDSVFSFIKEELPGFLGTTSVKWNFTKFLVDRNGYGFKRYSPQVSPDACCDDIEKLLAQPYERESAVNAEAVGEAEAKLADLVL